MKLILSYDEARKMGQHMNAMNPWVFEDVRVEQQPDDTCVYTEGKIDLEIVFEEDTSYLCKICGEYLEECICDKKKGEIMNNPIDLFDNIKDLSVDEDDVEETKFKREVVESTNYDKITEAKKVIREALDSDEQFKWGYICSIAMHLHDELCGDDIKLKVNRRNEIAEKLLKVIFYMGEKE